jgi:hypothetical protein
MRPLARTGEARALLLAAALIVLSSPARAAECVPEAESRATVVARGAKAGPLEIAPGRLCADLGGPPPPADLQIGVGLGDFGGAGAGALYGGDQTRRAPPDGAGPARR